LPSWFIYQLVVFRAMSFEDEEFDYSEEFNDDDEPEDLDSEE
jgi:hypothetical protein